MRLLFVTFALSFCALLWVAFSVARHIQRHDGTQQDGRDASVDSPGMEPEGVTAPTTRRP
jgi:hypothetical protein